MRYINMKSLSLSLYAVYVCIRKDNFDKAVLHFCCELLLIIKIEYCSKIIHTIIILPKILLLLVASVVSRLSLFGISGYIIKIHSLKKSEGIFIFFLSFDSFWQPSYCSTYERKLWDFTDAIQNSAGDDINFSHSSGSYYAEQMMRIYLRSHITRRNDTHTESPNSSIRILKMSYNLLLDFLCTEYAWQLL